MPEIPEKRENGPERLVTPQPSFATGVFVLVKYICRVVEAVVAFVLDQLYVTSVPAGMVMKDELLAVMEAVGTVTGCPATVTATVAETDPSPPVQVSV